MSMAGYILGLGDRHPCNIMLERNSGKIIHIDFGDTFEAAIQRDKYVVSGLSGVLGVFGVLGCVPIYCVIFVCARSGFSLQ